ncbi:MAG: hypothetical protein V4514_19875 [Pseudomonadota bacterium]|uniref:hypothetical protein n=1 Tax=Phenylobacterium sp. TaxID=1871053 RepID=UPI0025D33F2C|nr:hypothetical protein [Phenylobacterium sp.]MBT9472102.1 hypothetical protein [Phenylobacterium sp.]
MIAARIANATRRLGEPAGWDEARDGACDGLDVLILGDTFTSCWEPTPDELARLLSSGKVYLTCVGGQPPVALQVGEPHDL